jgi:hypothetical protein
MNNLQKCIIDEILPKSKTPDDSYLAIEKFLLQEFSRENPIYTPEQILFEVLKMGYKIFKYEKYEKGKLEDKMLTLWLLLYNYHKDGNIISKKLFNLYSLIAEHAKNDPDVTSNVYFYIIYMFSENKNKFSLEEVLFKILEMFGCKTFPDIEDCMWFIYEIIEAYEKDGGIVKNEVFTASGSASRNENLNFKMENMSITT